MDIVWERVVGHLKRAIDANPGGYDINGIYDALADSTMQLWAVYEGKELIAALATEIVDHPHARVCIFRLAGGSEIDAWIGPVEQAVGGWAKRMGCKALSLTGRRGWEKALPHWNFGGVILKKDL